MILKAYMIQHGIDVYKKSEHYNGEICEGFVKIQYKSAYKNMEFCPNFIAFLKTHAKNFQL